ncbi:MAG: outer membrane beta-barrel protein [Bacteroidota bacterium]
MKKVILFIVVLASGLIANIQASLSPGKYQLNAGFGLSDWGIPFYVGADYGLDNNFSTGGELSFRSYSENVNGKSYSNAITGISGNINYHLNEVFNVPENFDVYGGLNLGYYSWSTASGYAGSHSSGLGLGAQIGGRYYWSNNMGVNLELGGGNVFSSGKIGLTIKF